MARDEAGKKGEGYIMEAFPELFAFHFLGECQFLKAVEYTVSQSDVWPKGSLSESTIKNGEQRTRLEAARTGWKILCGSGGKE